MMTTTTMTMMTLKKYSQDFFIQTAIKSENRRRGNQFFYTVFYIVLLTPLVTIEIIIILRHAYSRPSLDILSNFVFEAHFSYFLSSAGLTTLLTRSSTPSSSVADQTNTSENTGRKLSISTSLSPRMPRVFIAQ